MNIRHIAVLSAALLSMSLALGASEYREQGRDREYAGRAHSDRHERDSRDRHYLDSGRDAGRAADHHRRHDREQYREHDQRRHEHGWRYRDHHRHDHHLAVSVRAPHYHHPRRVIYFVDDWGYRQAYYVNDDYYQHYYDPYYFYNGRHHHRGCHYHGFVDAVAAGIVLGTIMGDW